MNAGPHRHAEAFKLMHYRSEESGHELVVWNSRDGVTPYIFRHPDTRETYRHVEWHRDVYAPDHRPKVGEFFFEDLTRERALARRRREVVACWGRAEHGWPASDTVVLVLPGGPLTEYFARGAVKDGKLLIALGAVEPGRTVLGGHPHATAADLDALVALLGRWNPAARAFVDVAEAAVPDAPPVVIPPREEWAPKLAELTAPKPLTPAGEHLVDELLLTLQFPRGKGGER